MILVLVVINCNRCVAEGLPINLTTNKYSPDLQNQPLRRGLTRRNLGQKSILFWASYGVVKMGGGSEGWLYEWTNLVLLSFSPLATTLAKIHFFLLFSGAPFFLPLYNAAPISQTSCKFTLESNSPFKKQYPFKPQLFLLFLPTLLPLPQAS